MNLTETKIGGEKLEARFAFSVNFDIESEYRSFDWELESPFDYPEAAVDSADFKNLSGSKSLSLRGSSIWTSATTASGTISGSAQLNGTVDVRVITDQGDIWIPGVLSGSETYAGSSSIQDTLLSAFGSSQRTVLIATAYGPVTGEYTGPFAFSTTAPIINAAYPHPVSITVQDPLLGPVNIATSLITTNDTGAFDLAVSGSAGGADMSFRVVASGKHPNATNTSTPIGKVSLGYSTDGTASGVVSSISLTDEQSAIYWNTGMKSVRTWSLLGLASAAPSGAGFVVAQVANIGNGAVDASASNNSFSLPLPEVILTGNSVPENMLPGTAVGTLSMSVGEDARYSLLDGDPGFAIEGNKLVTALALDFESKSLYTIRVRATDSYNNYIERTFSISVVDEEPEGAEVASLKVSDLNLSPSNGSASFKVAITADRLEKSVPIRVYWGNEDKNPLPDQRALLWTSEGTTYAKSLAKDAPKNTFTIWVPPSKIPTAPPEAASLVVIADTDGVPGPSENDEKTALVYSTSNPAQSEYQPITPAQLAKVSPAAAQCAPQINAMFDRFGIKSLEQKAHLLAQMSVETSGFRHFTERLNYSTPQLLRDTFARLRGFSNQQLRPYLNARPGSDGEKRLAELVYGSTSAYGRSKLGNIIPLNLARNEAGDGWRFRGQGAIHLTGRSNFTAFQNDARSLLGNADVLKNPEVLGDPSNAACWNVAGWFFTKQQNGRSGKTTVDEYAWKSIGDEGTRRGAVTAVSLVVNGGTNGLGFRYQAYIRARSALLEPQ